MRCSGFSGVVAKRPAVVRFDLPRGWASGYDGRALGSAMDGRF